MVRRLRAYKLTVLFKTTMPLSFLWQSKKRIVFLLKSKHCIPTFATAGDAEE